MTFLQKIIMRETTPLIPNRSQELLETFDLYDPSSVQRFMEAFIEKSVCDCDGRHLGFVSDVMISTWNNKPEYLVLDAKIKPWHLRNAQFLYPLSSVNDVDTVKITIRDSRSTVYESSAFDPQVVELQENFPLLSLKSVAEADEDHQFENAHRRISSASEFWSDSLW